MRASLALSFFTLCVVSVAHDEPLTDKQREELKAVRPRLAGPLRAEEAQAIRKALSSFTVPGLREIEHHPEFRDLTEDEQGYLRHAVWAIAFAAEHERDLRDPWPSGLLLGSPMWSDWLEAIRLLEKEEFDKGLERVAVSLALDPRPQVRVGAGRLAKALTRFRGSSPACTAIAKRLFADPVPNVVMMFGAFDAHDFRDKELTDIAVARLRDRREIEPIPGITPWGAGGTVSATIAQRLYGEMMDRYAGQGPMDPARHVGAIEEWWRQNRDRYDFGLNPARWQLVGEWQGKCRKGEETEIALQEGRVWFAVLDYAEYWSLDRPVNDVTVRLRREGEKPENAGRICGKLQEDMERGLCGLGIDGENYRVEFLVAPDHTGNLRVSVRIWKGRRSP